MLFVYNADAGLWNGALDFAHKLVSPSTYACRLCAVTYGVTGMRARWRAFVADLPVSAVFLHRDEFLAAYPGAGVALPAVLLDRDRALTAVVDAAAMVRLTTVEALEAAVVAGLARAG